MPIDEIIAILKVEESESERSISEEFQPKIDHAYRLIADVRKVLEEQKDKLNVDDALKVIVTFHLAKSVRTVRAIVNLCKSGWAVEAQILLRSLVELMITLNYIVDGGLDRAILYIEHDHILKKDILENILKDEEMVQIVGYTEEDVREINSNYESVKKNYPNKYQWANKTIRKMADKVRLTFFYDYVYWMLSNTSHSNPRSGLYYMDVENDTPKFKFGPSSDWISPCLELSSEILIRVVSKLEEVFPIEIDNDLALLIERHREVFGPDEFAKAKES